MERKTEIDMAFPKCPKCKNVLSHLKVSREVIHCRGSYVLSKNAGKALYFCPECKKLLFDNEKQALRFIRGRKRWY